MAKTRRARPIKKGTKAKSKRLKPSRKAARRPKKAVKAEKKVELKKLREQFASVLVVLSSKGSASPDVAAKLDDTRRRISQWMTDIDNICTPELQEICGPDMAFPIP